VEIQITERLPSSEEYNQLRKMVGWGVYEREVIEKSLPNSLYCLCALAENETVGMARVIGDDGLVYYIQDVIVRPEYQRQGIGTKMMERVMTYIRGQAKHNTIIGLMAAKGKEPFYERYGFTARPNESFGSGMTIFWKGSTNP
jgi:GNAT superfamily N-acetyltransferase